jgi:parallel beta-helix repeat protein
MRKPQLSLPAVILGFLLYTAGPCIAADGQIKIAQTESTVFPIKINQPGSYVLTTNLQVSDPNRNGILIKTNDVTLDLNGHTIRGPQSGTGKGIVASNRYTITIRNGKVWGFGWGGIFIENDALHPGGGHIIEGVQCPNNGSTGITVTGGLVSNCTANNNGNVGITPTDSTVTNCTAINNASSGIYSVRSTISNCTIHDNGSDGITAFESTITDCSLQGNNGEGIAIWTNNVVKGCNARANGHYGYNIAVDGQNYVYRNVAGGNASGQFFCPGGNSCIDNVSW